MKYTHDDLKIQAYFYIHLKLEPVTDINVINENDICREFIYIRLRGSLPLIAQNDNIMEMLEESRKNVSYLCFIKKTVIIILYILIIL